MKRINQNILSVVLLLSGLTLPLTAVLAQADGSLPTGDASSSSDPEKPAVVDVPAPQSTPPQAEAGAQNSSLTSTGSEAVSPVSAPASSTSTVPPVSIVPPASPAPTPVVPSLEATATPAASPAQATPIPWIVLLILAVPFLGYGVAMFLKSRKNKDTEDCSRCLDLKELLEKKWKELTDIRGRVEGKLKEMAREEVREAVKGTATGDALILLEKTEKEYNRIKKLFEECMVDFERHAFRGVIIENSLLDTKVLKKIKVEQTREAGNQTIHHALVGKRLTSDFSKYLNEGPWYAYFWKPGKTETTVVFKQKVFIVDSTDVSTWVDAVAYGRSIGIPGDQLHFSEQNS